jgi:hypothetical protein
MPRYLFEVIVIAPFHVQSPPHPSSCLHAVKEPTIARWLISGRINGISHKNICPLRIINFFNENFASIQINVFEAKPIEKKITNVILDEKKHW